MEFQQGFLGPNPSANSKIIKVFTERNILSVETILSKRAARTHARTHAHARTKKTTTELELNVKEEMLKPERPAVGETCKAVLV